MEPEIPERLRPGNRQGVDRAFLCDEPLRNAVYAGKPGFLVRVRLTSYRALPLSCIERVELSVDGRPVALQAITFILNGQPYRLDELPHLSQIWWFILDTADLFVESSQPLTSGEHTVAGTLVTVEPYVTGGRFTFFYPSQRQLAVLPDL